jgi:hypothetical protein
LRIASRVASSTSSVGELEINITRRDRLPFSGFSSLGPASGGALVERWARSDSAEEIDMASSFALSRLGSGRNFRSPG